MRYENLISDDNEENFYKYFIYPVLVKRNLVRNVQSVAATTITESVMHTAYDIAANELYNNRNRNQKFGRIFEAACYIYYNDYLNSKPKVRFSKRTSDGKENPNYDLENGFLGIQCKSTTKYVTSFEAPYKSGPEAKIRDEVINKKGKFHYAKCSRIVEIYECSAKQYKQELNNILQFIKQNGLPEKGKPVRSENGGIFKINHEGKSTITIDIENPVMVKLPNDPTFTFKKIAEDIVSYYEKKYVSNDFTNVKNSLGENKIFNY